MADDASFYGLNPRDVIEYTAFRTRLLMRVKTSRPATVWHYTTADGLMGILCSGKLRATQVSCLNDNLEHLFFTDLIREEVRRRRIDQKHPLVNLLYDQADEAIGNRVTSALSSFVTCFSTAEDDLAQWRGYGGDLGYAIEFNTTPLMDAVSTRPDTTMFRMCYDEGIHEEMVQDFVDSTERMLLENDERDHEARKMWGDHIAPAYATLLEEAAGIAKHPKFKGEQEVRLHTRLRDGEHKDLKFTQKRTLLSRFLEIDFTKDGKLPIRRIIVGPGGNADVSRISVGDLLVKYEYKGVIVEKSKIPYRIP